MKKNLMICSFAIGISSFSLNAFAMPNNTDSYITKAEAKAIALQHADLEEAEVRFVKGTLAYDDGRALYEIEFLKDRKEYDYEIDATDGTILSYDHDIEARMFPVHQKRAQPSAHIPIRTLPILQRKRRRPLLWSMQV